MFKKKTKLAVVIPCYNEELVIENTISVLSAILDDLINKSKISSDSYFYLVDDGSKDKTWEIIERLHDKTPARVKGVKFVRNYGNQKALIAGLLGVKEFGCDCALTIDADLQQDENSIENFIDEFHNGAEIVSGIRNDRKTDTIFKKTTAFLFYKLMNLMGVKIPPNHSDFRLVSIRALNILEKFSESELFLRGFFHETGLKTAYVHFDVKPRTAGNSKFNFVTLTSLALNGITSYSIVPLRLISAIGLLTVLLSACVGFDAVCDKLFRHDAPGGWATLVMLIIFIGGFQILCLGIIGEYLGQIFSEVKARPRYITEKELL